MFKGTVSGYSATANTNIPMSVAFNTNNNTRYDNTSNAIDIQNSGIYNVDVIFNITGSTPTTIGAQLYNNGVAISESLAQTDITATTGVQTINIHDTIRVVPNSTNAFAELSVRLNGVATISNGIVTIERVK